MSDSHHVAPPEPGSSRFAGRVALVTGAASGIGRATALHLAACGARVLFTDRDATAVALAAQAAAPGAVVRPLSLNVTSASDWQRALDAARQWTGRLDVLVNAAGVSHAAALVDLTLDDWRRVMAVNVEGTMLGTQAAAKVMLSQSQGGCIVNVASVSGVKPFAGASLYCASKAAVIQFSKAAALELRRQNPSLRVCVISPSGVRTALWRSMPFFQDMVRQHGGEEAAFAALASTAPSGRFAEAEEVAAAIAYLAGDEARYLSGVNFLFDDGESA